MHEAFTWMRANDPLHRCEHSGFVAVTRHADVLDVERRDGVFSSQGRLPLGEEHPKKTT